MVGAGLLLSTAILATSLATSTLVSLSLVSFLSSIPPIKKTLFTHLDSLLFLALASCTYAEVPPHTATLPRLRP